jgi:hypothetical protein
VKSYKKGGSQQEEDQSQLADKPYINMTQKFSKQQQTMSTTIVTMTIFRKK